MAKDKNEKKDSDPDFLIPIEEGAIEIPEPENDSTIAMSGSDSEKAEALDPPEVEVDMFEEITEVSVENTASTTPDESGDFSGLDEIETTKQPEIKKTMLARDSDIQSALGDSGLNAPDFGMGSLDEESPAPSPKKTQLASKQSKHTQFAPAGSEIEPNQEESVEVPSASTGSANEFITEDPIAEEIEGTVASFDQDSAQEIKKTPDEDDFDKYIDSDINQSDVETENIIEEKDVEEARAEADKARLEADKVRAHAIEARAEADKARKEAGPDETNQNGYTLENSKSEKATELENKAEKLEKKFAVFEEKARGLEEKANEVELKFNKQQVLRLQDEVSNLQGEVSNLQDKIDNPPPSPRKRGGILIGTLMGTILGAGVFGGLYEYGIEIPQEYRIKKSDLVIALENGKESAEKDATNKAAEVVKIKEEKDKISREYENKEKDFLAKHEAELKKAADDKKIALDEADKTYKDSLKDAEKKLADQKAEADKTLKETMVAADKKIKETEDTAKKEIAEEKKATEKKLTEADTKYTMLKGEKTKVDEALKKSEDFVASIGSELAQANLVKDKFNPVNVVGGLKKGMEIIQSKDPQGMIRGLQTNLADTTVKFTKQIEVVDKKLKESRQPGEMLDYWRSIMEKKGQAELEKKATEDVEKVMVDASANAELKARAEVLKGITLRNQGKYVEAKAALEKGKAGLNAGDIAWKLQADVALKEANDPVSHFVELSKKQESMNQIDESINSLGKAIELSAQFSPKRRPELLSDRCLVKIERAQARAKGKVQPNDPILLEAAKDADEAIQSKSALSYYAKGRVAEVRGEVIDAIEFYRKAVNENKALDAQGIKYRIALARLLNSVLPPNTKPKEPEAEKVGVIEKKDNDMISSLTALLLTGFFFQQPEIVFPPESPKISPKESMKLADQILASPDAPFDAKAQAYAIKGLPTKAIREYVNGLRDKIGPIHFENLMKIIEDHPSLTNHNLANQANPVEAERFFATGLALYFNKKYLEAEKAFMAAVENERQDARYQYYLGLARLAQNKAEAAEAFEAASKYEKLGRPSRAAVSTSLERVQGPQRQVLNMYRNNPNR